MSTSSSCGASATISTSWCASFTRRTSLILVALCVGSFVIALAFAIFGPAFESVGSCEANAYSNEVVEKAEGEFQRIVRAAEAYKEETVAKSEGAASRFLAVFEQYKQQRDVTTQRIYLETMRDVMRDMDKVLIDNSKGGSGVLPYLPLDELSRGSKKTGGSQ